MPRTDPIISMLEPFRCVFTAPTWRKMLTLLRGTLLARGRRTVTAALGQTGHEQDPHFSAFHQVLNRARWSPLQASRHLLQLLIETFVQAGGTLDIVIDETLERRWGSKIRKRGHYRDSALSSHERSVSSPGLRWIVLAIVVTVPWTKQRNSGGPCLFSVCWPPLQRSARNSGSATKPSGCGRAKW
jgi:DDE superfamily endonuclease